MVQGTYEALKVEIDNLKDDVKEIKNDLKEDIKEIKHDNRESNKHFREAIDILKENSIRQTEILNNQEKQFTDVNNAISGLQKDFENNISNQSINIMGLIKNIIISVAVGSGVAYFLIQLGLK